MRKRCGAALAVAAAGLWIAGVQASGPIAVYALVDKVSFEPDAGHPQRLRMEGVFLVASVPEGCGSPSSPCTTTYGSPERGWLYFSLPDREADAALREWADLKAIAGTKQVVGFGSGWHPTGIEIHRENEKKAPVAFPLNNGLVKVNADRPEAKALLDFKDR